MIEDVERYETTGPDHESVFDAIDEQYPSRTPDEREEQEQYNDLFETYLAEFDM